jgi:hypothetical protein
MALTGQANSLADGSKRRASVRAFASDPRPSPGASDSGQDRVR